MDALVRIESLMFHSSVVQIPPVAEKGENEFLRFSALSNAGFEMDGLQKTNQDTFISIANLGKIHGLSLAHFGGGHTQP